MADRDRVFLRSGATLSNSDPMNREGHVRAGKDWIVILTMLAGVCLWSVTFWPRFGR
jgi:hypothetical protein